MKKSMLSLVLFLTVSAFNSCSKENDEEDDTEPQSKEKKPEVIIDKYTYLALRNDGVLFEIGDETGEIKEVDKIDDITFNIFFNSITNSGSKTYIYEQMPEIIPDDGTTTGFRGQLCELDNETLDYRCKVLNFSHPIFPEFSGLIALDWDSGNNTILGLVRDVVNDAKEIPNYVVRIDADTFEITYTGLQFVESNIISTSLAGSEYYVSTKNGGGANDDSLLIKIDLITGERTVFDTSGADSSPFLLSTSGDGKFFGLSWKFGTGYFNSAVPVSFKFGEGLTEIETPKRISFMQEFGKSFFNNENKEHILLMGSADGAGLMHFNSVDRKIKITDLKPVQNDLSSLIAIIGVK